MRPALLVVALLALLPPPALAHGASVEFVQQEGPYTIRFVSFDGLTAGEFVRALWNVTRTATGERVPLEAPHVEVAFLDPSGRVVNSTVVALSQPANGIVYTDLFLGGEGRVRYALALPEGRSTVFEQPINPAGFVPPPPPGGNGTPWPGTLALLAVGGAALLARRR